MADPELEARIAELPRASRSARSGRPASMFKFLSRVFLAKQAFNWFRNRRRRTRRAY